MWFLNIFLQYALLWVCVLMFPLILLNWIYNAITNFMKRRKSMQGKVILITGAGNGIGRELAIRFAKEKCTVICVDVNTAGNEETVKIIQKTNEIESNKIETYTCDVTNKFAVNNVAEKVLEKYGNVDILINNAGITNPGSLLDTSDFHIERLLEVNLTAHFWTIRAFLPRMKEKQSGMIVAISSTAAHFGVTQLVPYCASKHGVTGLMKALYHELRVEKSPVKTLTIHPGFTATNMIPEKYRKPQWVEMLEISSVEWMAKQIVNAIKEEKLSVVIPGNQSIVFYFSEYILPEWLRHLILPYVGDLRKFLSTEESKVESVS